VHWKCDILGLRLKGNFYNQPTQVLNKLCNGQQQRRPPVEQGLERHSCEPGSLILLAEAPPNLLFKFKQASEVDEQG
jgi:hypothetical protein